MLTDSPALSHLTLQQRKVMNAKDSKVFYREVGTEEWKGNTELSDKIASHYFSK